MNLQIDCPHCHRAITAPADVEVECPLCRGKLIAERPVLRAAPRRARLKSGNPIALTVLLVLVLGVAYACLSSPQKLDAETVAVFIGTALGTAVYFIPTFIAARRSAVNSNLIFILNLLLGVTVIGWIAAFIWAAVDQQLQEEASPAPAAPARQPRSQASMMIVMVLLLGVLIVIMALGTKPAARHAFASDVADAHAERELRRVEYRVTQAPGKVMITMSKPGGSIEQHDARSLPWSHEFSAYTGEHISLSAQNQSDYGTVGVTILVNGVTVKSASSNADYGIASVHASVP